MIIKCWTPQSNHRDTFFSIYLVIIIIDHNKNTPVKKHVCGSQRRNGRDMTSRRRPTSRQHEVLYAYRERQC